MSLEEFKALNHVVPNSDLQALRIIHSCETFMRRHPELSRDVERFFVEVLAVDAWRRRAKKEI